MADGPRQILVCSCEDTIPLDVDGLRRACLTGTITAGRQLCRAELARVQKALQAGDPVTIACTQETPLFNETAAQSAKPEDTPVAFVNIRENAGWSKDAAAAGPKMAALIAAAAEPEPELAYASFTSEGATVIYGIDDQAIEAARLLKDHLAITVVIKPPADISPPRTTDFAVHRGTVRVARGYLGNFNLSLDDQAAPSPASRDSLIFGPARRDVQSRCDILIDLTGGPALFPAADLREGYLRADPRDPAAVLRVVLKARDLTGSFDKPRYVNFTADLCAHSRSKIVGCRRCLDLCPTGAVAPNGDHVAIDPHICAGCGQCAAACPTGAAAYALPPSDAMLRRLRTLLTTYRDAGGAQAVMLFHDGEHGVETVAALARYGDGLPANVIPVKVNEITQIGLESVAAAFAYGASAVRFLTRARPRHDLAGLERTVALAGPVLAGLGFDGARVATIATDDPDALALALGDIATAAPPATPKPATFSAVGEKRDVVRLSLRALHAAAPAPVDIVALPEGAPFGTVEVKVEGCTLCLSCVSACPTGALSDDPDRPMLRFAEDACVQCGLCKATCPEKVISLRPQIDFRAATADKRVIKQEEPFLCISCGTPFGVKSSVERVIAKLEGKHWMFKDSKKRLDAIKMCADCRVNVMVEGKFDPLAGPPRPAVRTTDDYLREREEAAKREN